MKKNIVAGLTALLLNAVSADVTAQSIESSIPKPRITRVALSYNGENIEIKYSSFSHPMIKHPSIKAEVSLVNDTFECFGREEGRSGEYMRIDKDSCTNMDAGLRTIVENCYSLHKR